MSGDKINDYDAVLLGSDAQWTHRQLLTFRRNTFRHDVYCALYSHASLLALRTLSRTRYSYHFGIAIISSKLFLRESCYGGITEAIFIFVISLLIIFYF